MEGAGGEAALAAGRRRRTEREAGGSVALSGGEGRGQRRGEPGRGGPGSGLAGPRWRGAVEGNRLGEVAAPGWLGAAAEVTCRVGIGSGEVAAVVSGAGRTRPAARRSGARVDLRENFGRDTYL